MFSEVPKVRQIEGEPKRRWFVDDDLELIAWFGGSGGIIGFQLCYKSDDEHKAITWHEGEGYCHSGIDDGEGRPGRHKASPILVCDGVFDKENIGKRFARSAGSIPPGIAAFISRKIAEYSTENV